MQSLSLNNLSVLAYANGFTLWHLKYQKNGKELINKPDFFNGAFDLVRTGDLIVVVCLDGVFIAAVGLVEDGKVSTSTLSKVWFK